MQSPLPQISTKINPKNHQKLFKQKLLKKQKKSEKYLIKLLPSREIDDARGQSSKVGILGRIKELGSSRGFVEAETGLRERDVGFWLKIGGKREEWDGEGFSERRSRSKP